MRTKLTTELTDLGTSPLRSITQRLFKMEELLYVHPATRYVPTLACSKKSYACYSSSFQSMAWTVNDTLVRDGATTVQ